MTAKQIFDHVAMPREMGATVSYQTTMKNLLNIKFTTREVYIDNFMRNYLGEKGAPESMVLQSSESEIANSFVILHGVTSHLFIIRTDAIEWLPTGR